MAINDLILLDKIIDDKFNESVKKISMGEFFENFCNEQILKNYDLSLEEIEDCITDGSNDGGIDAIYIFANGGLLKDSDDLEYLKKESSLEIVIITSKHDNSFEQAVINSEYTTISEFFNLALSNNELINPYNERILEKRKLFIQSYMQLATKLKTLKIRYIYVSRGNSQLIGENVLSKSQQVLELTKSYFSDCIVSYDFLGASEVLSLYRKKKEFDLNLPFSEQLSADRQKYIILCNIKDYYQFVKDDKNELKRYLFDSNVRDYNGLNKTNTEILQTLSNDDNVDFWWLNNGITILSSNAVNMGKFIKIENVQIVNGLQTSYTIFEYFNDHPDIEDDRKLMVKIITETDCEIRDKIIRATNSQTSIQEASLHATDKIQRDIEDILLKYNMYYERRVNFYKNQGYDESLIYSPLYLASGYVSLVGKNVQEAIKLKQKFMQSKISYNLIYEETPIEFWPKIARILRRADLCIIEKRNSQNMTTYEGYLKTVRHMLALITLSKHFGKFSYNYKDLERLTMSEIEQLNFDEVFEFINNNYPTYDKKTWKSSPFINMLIEEAAQKYEIKNPQAAIKGKKNFVPNFFNRPDANLDTLKVNSIKNELPSQPWPKGIAKQIAEKLELSNSYVSAAIAYLIQRGDFYTQINGRLYDKEGNLVKNHNISKS